MSTAPSGFQNPKTTWQAADIPLSDDFKRIEGNAQATELGNRTVDQAQAPSGNVGTLRQFLDWFANRIKAILGTTNWYSAPPITLTTAKAKADILDAHVGIGGNTHPAATTSTAGFMSASDKQRLDDAPMTDTEILDAVKRVDGPGSGLDADAWVGLKWVKPGNGIVFDEMLDEIYLGSNVGYFYFVALRPGMYRISGEVKSNNTSYEVVVQMYKSFSFSTAEGTILSLANEFRTSSTAYVAFNIDMNIPAMPGEIILVRVYHSDKDIRKYIRNLRLTASEGTPTIPQNSNFFVWHKV